MKRFFTYLYVVIKGYEFVKPNKIFYELMIPRKLKKYFNELPFYIEYDIDIEEIKSEAVLYIPIVAALTPIAWASGFELHAPTLDRNFLNSIKEVSKTFKRSYPKLHTNIQINLLNLDKSQLKIKRKVENEKFGLLFSGGVDSTYSLIKHLNKKPNLINIVDLDFYYPPKNSVIEMIKDKLQKIALGHNLEINFIQSNLRRFINEKQLSLEFGINLGSSWWGGFAHMINTLGLCSLLTIKKALQRY